MEGTETVSPKYERHMHTLLIPFALTEPQKALLEQLTKILQDPVLAMFAQNLTDLWIQP